MQMGIFGFPLIIISVVVVALAIKKAVDLFGGGDLETARLENGLHAIIFWGGVGAVLGVLGQASGIYNALGVISRASEISPQITAMGLAESFTTTIFGLTILIVSAILWFVLYTRYRRVISKRG